MKDRVSRERMDRSAAERVKPTPAKKRGERMEVWRFEGGGLENEGKTGEEGEEKEGSVHGPGESRTTVRVRCPFIFGLSSPFKG